MLFNKTARQRRRRRRRTAEKTKASKKKIGKTIKNGVHRTRRREDGHVRTGGSSGATTVVDDDGGWCQRFQFLVVVVEEEEKSFEAKLKRVREEGETRAKMTGGTGGSTPSSSSSTSPAAFGGTPTMTPISPLAPTFGGDESFSTKDDDEEEGAFKSPLVRVGALLAAMALASCSSRRI